MKFVTQHGSLLSYYNYWYYVIAWDDPDATLVISITACMYNCMYWLSV